jgi:outer membrane protein assembly factor BamD (BamD/ComL family)
LLDDHARRFPAGSLIEEREATRVLALCRVGRVSEAKDAASRFLREHPRSPQASRVEHACDGDTNF